MKNKCNASREGNINREITFIPEKNYGAASIVHIGGNCTCGSEVRYFMPRYWLRVLIII